MTKNTLLLVTLVVISGGICLYVNKDWFSRRPIQITHRFHAFGGRFDTTGGVAPLMFEFSRTLKLTSVKVVCNEEFATNRHCHALWQVVSDSNSVPTKGFLYGMNVPGMRPSIKGALADPLDPEQKYRLIIEAGSAKAEHEFDLNPASP